MCAGGAVMEILVEKRNEILAKVDIIVKKAEKDDNDASLPQRQQLVLILSNLLHVLESCDEKYLLKQILDSITTTLSHIETYVNRKDYTSAQTYLAEIVRNIAFLNNANGKQSLRGYQSAVNKSVRLLEETVENSVLKLEELKLSSAEQADELSALNAKYEKFASDLSKKQEDSYAALLEEQKDFKKEYGQEVLNLKEDISKTKTSFQTDVSTTLADFEAEKVKKLEELENQIEFFVDQTNQKLELLKASATEKIGYVASATYSNIYQTYSDQARKASRWWYAATLISLVCLIVLSICWFVIKEYNNTDYVLLIARICASVGFAVVSRYSAIQASKNKVMETKLRKIQLQMATFDAFVASLDKEEQDKLKIELTHKLIEQEDWLVHDKNEIDTIKDVVKLLEKSGYKVDLKKPE